MYKHPLITAITVLAICFWVSCGSSYSHEVIEKHPDGSTKLIHYFKEKDGKKLLYKSEEFFDNGIKRMEGYYEGDQPHGQWNSWHYDGKLWSVAGYKEGQLHGKQTVYYPSGRKFYEGSFENGIRTGVWNFWNEKGELVNTETY